jgi:hypothetical protein
MKQILSLFFHFLILNNCYSQDFVSKEQVYLEIIQSINSICTGEEVSYNINPLYKYPKEYSADGYLGSQVYSELDSVDVNLLANLNILSVGLDLSNYQYESEFLISEKNKGQYMIFIYPPIDYWLNYYHTIIRCKMRPDLEFRFEKIYIPVKIFYTALSERQKPLYMLYIIDINEGYPELMKMITLN